MQYTYTSSISYYRNHKLLQSKNFGVKFLLYRLAHYIHHEISYNVSKWSTLFFATGCGLRSNKVWQPISAAIEVGVVPSWLRIVALGIGIK